MKNNKIKLSIAPTYNEEKNIKRFLDNFKDIGDEIIIVDGHSSDKTIRNCSKNTIK
jgi:glycosyltransferase involved in cell wall biosynthesis